MKETNVTNNSYDFHDFINQLIFYLVLSYGINYILNSNNMINLLPITVITLCLIYLNNYFYDNHHYDGYLYKNYFFNEVD